MGVFDRLLDDISKGEDDLEAAENLVLRLKVCGNCEWLYYSTSCGEYHCAQDVIRFDGIYPQRDGCAEWLFINDWEVTR